MEVHWYPGHMARGLRELKAKLSLVDVVVELVDARAPQSTRNLQLGEALGDVPRLTVLSKADLAEPGATRAWLAAYRREQGEALALERGVGRSYAQVRRRLQSFAPAVPPLIAKTMGKQYGRSVRALACGVPNVGKSSLINQVTGRRGTKVGARPGVTRSQQWLEGNGVAFLDTPGLLWPKLADPEQALCLVWLAAIDVERIDAVACAAALFDRLLTQAAHVVAALCPGSPQSGEAALRQFALRRGFTAADGEPDTARAAAVALREFGAGKWGRVTLERAPSEGRARG